MYSIIDYLCPNEKRFFVYIARRSMQRLYMLP
jgi:hypothetical protein